MLILHEECEPFVVVESVLDAYVELVVEVGFALRASLVAVAGQIVAAAVDAEAETIAPAQEEFQIVFVRIHLIGLLYLIVFFFRLDIVGSL